MRTEPVLLFAAGELIVVIFMGVIIARLGTSDPQTRLLYFGAVVLTALALVFALGMAMYFWTPNDPVAVTKGQKIFDACVTVVPPLVTLIIGYFGQQQR
jgi:hypothetical protein